MVLMLKILIYLCLWTGVHCVHQISWLPCQFTDERVSVNNEGHIETQLINRDSMLQFGQRGDSPVNPHAITFLVTGSRVDLRRHVEGVAAEQLECDIRRYSTEGIHVRWPVQEPNEYNRWFIYTLKHTEGQFTVTGFLRLPSNQPPSGQQDYRSWAAIGDTEMLITTPTMVIKTQTPVVKATLGSQQKLHCQFAVDHKGPNATIEWYWQYRGERTKLFSHTSRKGVIHGGGVVVKSLAGGDASYTLPFAKMSSEGMYVCSVDVMPLFASMDINLHIEEPPRVSLNIGPSLSLVVGEEQKVVCEAENYYPLDVQIDWTHQDPAAVGQRVGAPLPKPQENVLLSSHKNNLDKTFSMSAFFYLEASLQHSGRQFTCSVSHRSLRVPIKKSFILTVEEPVSWLFYLAVLLFITVTVLLLYWYSGRKKSVQKKPY